MSRDSQCPLTVTPRHQITTTQAEIVGDRWLPNTLQRVATLTYDQHDTSTRIDLPSQTLWVTVTEGAILHLHDLTIFDLNSTKPKLRFLISLANMNLKVFLPEFNTKPHKLSILHHWRMC